MAARTIIAQLFTGAVVVRPIGLSAGEQATRVDAMSDATIHESLTKLNVDPMPETAADRRARLRGWPSPEDLDAIGAAYATENGGVPPTVRVLENATLPGRSIGTAGSVPR